MSYWYFGLKDGLLRFNDNRKVVIGKTHKVEGEPVLCQHGLHASKTIWDALSYAPGPILYKVRLGGKIVHSSDKSVATERAYLSAIDATDLLHKFARLCALDVVHLWDAPDIVVKHLKTGDESLRAAARDAAWDATRDAARDAAWDAAWDAARDAARAAATAAARAAAREPAWDAAWAAAMEAGSAARAARSAGWAAAWEKKQKRRLSSMVSAQFKKEARLHGND